MALAIQCPSQDEVIHRPESWIYKGGQTILQQISSWKSQDLLQLDPPVERNFPMIKTKDLYSFDHSLAGAYLKQFEYPWQALKGIGDLIKTLSKDLSKDDYEEKEPSVFVHKTARIYPNTYLGAPCIIGANTEVRPGAFIRGNALVGEDCVVGNSTELKNVILFDHVQVPHYNYVGDSILGYYSHMGAGSITSNVKSDKTLVVVKDKDEEIKTGLKKMGAMLGDHVEVGCNSVLNPGTIIGKGTSIYPLSCVRHVVPAGMIYKDKDHITKRDDKHWSKQVRSKSEPRRAAK